MKRMTWMLAALVPLLGGMRQAKADALNPGDFTSLGQLTLGPGSYTVNTDTLQLTGTGGVQFTGVLSGGSAVFDFSQINLSAGATLTATGSHSLALLSQGDATLNGSVHFVGSDGAMGAVGAQGHAGADGAQGVQGFTGSPGAQGRAGSNARGVSFTQPIFETISGRQVQVGQRTPLSVVAAGNGSAGGRGGPGGPGDRGGDGSAGGQGGQGGTGGQGKHGGSVEIGAIGNISAGGGGIHVDGGKGGNGGAGGAGGIGGAGGRGGVGGVGGQGGQGGQGGRGGFFSVGTIQSVFGHVTSNLHTVFVPNSSDGPRGANGANGPQGASGHAGATGATGL